MTRGFRRTGTPKPATYSTWWNQAICRQFPHRLAEPLWNRASDWRSAGRMLCQVCPVRDWCLATALTQRLWSDPALRGGLTYRERTMLKQDIRRSGLHVFGSGLSREAQATIIEQWVNDRRIDAAKAETARMWRDYKRNRPARRKAAYRQADFAQILRETADPKTEKERPDDSSTAADGTHTGGPQLGRKTEDDGPHD